MRTNLCHGGLALFFNFVLLQGCSFFAAKSENNGDSPNGTFKATVSQATNPVPMPIEVATEISRLASRKERSRHPTVMTDDDEVAPRDLASNSSECKEEGEDQGEGEETSSVCTVPKSNVDRKSTSIKKTNKKSTSSKNGKHFSYKVRVGDTLMKISFEKFGNVYRWREIYDGNRESIRNFNILVPGTVLSISGTDYIVIEKNGKPYLIKKRDTLVKISKSLYGTPRQWKSLWTNNRQLIHDPNKIYAGFTLYYKPKERP